jgi:hypothetical protein
MRLFFLSLLLITGFRLSAAEPVLKFTLTKADGTPAAYEFLVPSDDATQTVTLSHDEAVLRSARDLFAIRRAARGTVTLLFGEVRRRVGWRPPSVLCRGASFGFGPSTC